MFVHIAQDAGRLSYQSLLELNLLKLQKGQATNTMNDTKHDD
jgi:hypothetical protein